VDAAGIRFDGAEEVPPQPGNLDEQPGVGCFADGQEQPDVVLRQAEALAELGHIRGQQRHFEVGERDADIRGTDHLGRQGADGLAQLHAEDRPAHVLQH
jgi:hypothetical protein